VRTQQISTHWLRHTTLTWVERNFGFAIAHAYAGHTDGAGDTGGATSTYVRATIAEVAAALAALTSGSGEEPAMALLLHLRLRDYITAEDDPDRENNRTLDGWGYSVAMKDDEPSHATDGTGF
jgi:hypothetical protein